MEYDQERLCAPGKIKEILAVLPHSGLGISLDLSESGLYSSFLKLGIFQYLVCVIERKLSI